MPDRILPCQGLLFDLDGTLIDSIPAVERAWTTWANMHGLDPAYVLDRIHGRRAKDSLAALGPHLDLEEQHTLLAKIETEDTEGVRLLPGTAEFLASLDGFPWAVVTSCTRSVALARIHAVRLPDPPVLVVGDDIPNGKPAPDPFLRGAELLGVPIGETVSFEDAESGIRSATVAGSQVVVVGEHPVLPWVRDLRDVVLERAESGTQIHLNR